MALSQESFSDKNTTKIQEQNLASSEVHCSIVYITAHIIIVITNYGMPIFIVNFILLPLFNLKKKILYLLLGKTLSILLESCAYHVYPEIRKYHFFFIFQSFSGFTEYFLYYQLTRYQITLYTYRHYIVQVYREQMTSTDLQYNLIISHGSLEIIFFLIRKTVIIILQLSEIIIKFILCLLRTIFYRNFKIQVVLKNRKQNTAGKVPQLRT